MVEKGIKQGRVIYSRPDENITKPVHTNPERRLAPPTAHPTMLDTSRKWVQDTPVAGGNAFCGESTVSERNEQQMGCHAFRHHRLVRLRFGEANKDLF
jgi:hypothetical protein